MLWQRPGKQVKGGIGGIYLGLEVLSRISNSGFAVQCRLFLDCCINLSEECGLSGGVFHSLLLNFGTKCISHFSNSIFVVAGRLCLHLFIIF
jgi:hypothetical protein